METSTQLLVILLLITAAGLVISRSFPVPLLLASGFLGISFPLVYGWKSSSAILSGICLLVAVASVYLLVREKRLTLGEKAETKRWRVFARPAALLFIPISEYAGHHFLVYMLGILCIIFISADLYRLFSRRRIEALYKRSEARRFSSMTSFIIAMFIIFLLFRDEIAYLCLVFIVFGDLFAKVAGLSYGRTTILRKRTLEGSLGFLSGSLFFGAISAFLFDIPFSYLLTGAGIATIVELFSSRVDDNFTVSILTAVGLTALEYFGIL